jgi:hypothetical protein
MSASQIAKLRIPADLKMQRQSAPESLIPHPANDNVDVPEPAFG